MKAYSQDLRERVLRAIDAGASQIQVAETFAISTATIKRYLKQRRGTGHVLPKAIPGRPNVVGVALQAGLEEAFSKVKAFLRRTGARTREGLQEAIAQALELVTAQDALGWFLHCGYPPPVLDGKAQ